MREPLSIDVQSPLYMHPGVTRPPLMVTPIPHSRATRIRLSSHIRSSRSRRTWIGLAFVLTGLLLASSLATLATGPEAHANTSVSSDSVFVAGRVATLWPFSRDSIWNLPIGANAVYVPANIKKPTASGMTSDVDVLILTPDAPVTDVWKNNDAWSGGSRCNAQGGVLFSAPIPTDFVVPGAGSGNPDGTTPNYATAILAADGHTLIQGQPMARCTAGGTATMMWSQQNEDLYGTGNSGAHGGSMLSSLGGVIRLGELVPGGTIRHALKVNLFGADDYYTGYGSYRWPATTADGCAPGCYGGSVPSLRMGSLLALPPSIDVNSMGLETNASKILAHTFQDYGGYTVDDAAWSVYAIATEYSASGSSGASNWYTSSVTVTLTATDDSSGIAAIHFRADGGPWKPYSNPVPVSGEGSHMIEYYATDLAGNNESSHTVTFQIDTVAPVTLAQVAGTLAGDGSYVSSVTVTLTASDATSGVRSEQYRVDGGPWRTYSAPFTLGGNGAVALGHFATDVAGSAESVQGLSIRITGDSHVLPVSTLSSSGVMGENGWYVSAVTVTLTATSGNGIATSIAYRIDGNAWVTYSQPFTLPDGRHILVYQATDADGYSEVSKSIAFNVDSTPPSVIANSPGVPIAPDTLLSWSGSDAGSGIARYEVGIDGAAFVSVGLQTSLARHWSNGTHVVIVRGYDAAGNAKSSQMQFTVSDNASPPPPTLFGSRPTAPPGILEVVVGLLMLGVSMWYRPRVNTRRPIRSR